jgi:hypothetical protein
MSNISNTPTDDKKSYLVIYRDSETDAISSIETVIGTNKLRKKLLTEYQEVINKLEKTESYKLYFEGENCWELPKDLVDVPLDRLCFETTQFMTHIAKEVGTMSLMCNVIEGKLIV